MSGRFASLGIASALLIALAGVIGASCYEVPAPDCGFLCGPNGACPDDYTCADDHRCHRIGTPADLVCSTPDAAMPDGTSDAIDGFRDVTPDAMPDVTIDAMPDVMIDATVAAGGV